MYSSDYRASDSMWVGSKGSPTTKYAYAEPMSLIEQFLRSELN